MCTLVQKNILYMCGLWAGWALESPYLHPYLFKFTKAQAGTHKCGYYPTHCRYFCGCQTGLGLIAIPAKNIIATINGLLQIN